MRKVVSREKAQRESLYGSIRILGDGRVRFDSEPGSFPTVEFAVQRHTCELDGRWVYDSANYGISARRNGETVLLLFVRRSRIRSACFSYILDPSTLRRGVTDLLKTGNGIERWLTPALEATYGFLKTAPEDNPALLKAIPAVLRSLEGIPRADRPARTAGKQKAPSRRATADGQRRRGAQGKKRDLDKR